MRFLSILLIFFICFNLLAKTPEETKKSEESSQFSFWNLVMSILPLGLAFHIGKQIGNKPPEQQDYRDYRGDFQPKMPPAFLGTLGGVHPNSGDFLVMPPVTDDIPGLRGTTYFRYPHLYRTILEQEFYHPVPRPQQVEVLILGGGLTPENVPAQVFELYGLYSILASQINLNATMTLVDLSLQVLRSTGRYNIDRARFVIDQDVNLGPEATRLRQNYFLPILRATPNTMPRDIRTIQANFRDWQPAAQTYDRIVATYSLIYAFDGLTMEEGRVLLGRYIGALRSGGHLYVEIGFLTDVLMNYVQITQRGLTEDLVDFEGTQLSVSTYENPTDLRRAFVRFDSQVIVPKAPQVMNGPTLGDGKTPSFVSSDIVLIKKVQIQ